jgi:glutamate dehydrogenase
MNKTSISTISQAIEIAVNAIEELHHELDLVKMFASILFSRISNGGLDVYSADCLAELAISTYKLFDVRERNAARLYAYEFENPVVGPFTVIEIVNDDMPFIVSSVLAELNARGLNIRFIAHPVMWVQRDGESHVTDIYGERTAGRNIHPESVLHIHVDQMGADARNELVEALHDILREVQVVVADWKPMLSCLREAIDAYAQTPPPVPPEELSESVELLKWLADGNFALLGMRNYDLVMRGDEPHLEPILHSGLGLLRDPERAVIRHNNAATEMSPETHEFFISPAPLIITKANFLSPVHRRNHIDSISIKLYNGEGALTGELRLIGLFTANAYYDTTERIPFLRHKVHQVFQNSGNTPASYSGRVLLNVLESFPRDELFQMSVSQLTTISAALIELELMPRTRVFIRRDDFGRFASVLVYLRRDRYSTAVRARICAFLERTYDGKITEYTPFFTVGPLVRLHVIVWHHDSEVPEVAPAVLEKEISAIVRTWRDELHDLLQRQYGPEAAGFQVAYGDAFPPGYEDSNSPERALQDIERIEKLSSDLPVGIDFFCDAEQAPNELRVMLYQLNEPIPLSKRVPVLENFGFSVIAEQTFEVTPLQNGERYTVFLHDMQIETASGAAMDLPKHDLRLEDCFLAVWHNNAGNDLYNSLIVQAGMNWREAALMRAFGSYLRQIGAPFSRTYLATTLNRHADIAVDLLELFMTLFDPGRKLSAEIRQKNAAAITQRIERRLDQVESLDEDRMLRRYLNLIGATLRTNFYQKPTELTAGSTIALKIRSSKVEGMPAPKPFAEIFVTSPRFEGIHLRGGPIARGGIRWSDRPQDFRTEILGLAKAQQVKNAIIVPQGAKGGFVPRFIHKNASREEVMAEGMACYRCFIANLLSVTDNLKLKEGTIVPPSDTLRLDPNDPYLVVAADKGTATFSDIANDVAVGRDFWLGDAFASGGSAGYDHKKMAITARGAWEAVKRHFREMNIDIQTTPFRVVGVGDMSGDVFGNGMRLSRQIKLMAAFDHRDIFIDPAPDLETSWQERDRLFALPRSSWQDYNRALISPGGGVFSRSAKSIPLSPEMQDFLCTTLKSATPNEVIRHILKAQVDLLWFGGIGTFIRASSETDEDVNDRANDTVRITGAEIRAKVVGEGANLGLTQRGRIEFASAGGRINTDAIDNSAGVNTSDLEVNIKIALSGAVRSGAIKRDERDRILLDMTDEVAAAVLRNNHLQTLAISIDERRGWGDLGFQTRLMHTLEQAEILDRAIEKLPSDSELAERRKERQPLTRPELAVLLAYAKIGLYAELNKSPVLDDPYLSRELTNYFPASMRERMADEIANHPLRREIIAAALDNAIINRGGATFAVRLREETGRDAGEIACAFAAAMNVFRFGDFFDAVDGLNTKIDGAKQLSLYVMIQDALRRQTAWFLRYGHLQSGLSAIIERFRDGIDKLHGAIESIFDEWLTGRLEDSMNRLRADGVPDELVHPFAHLGALCAAPNIISLAMKLNRSEQDVARTYFQIASHFRLEEMRAASEVLGQTDYFNRLAVNAVLEAVASAQRAIVKRVYASSSNAVPDFMVWCGRYPHAAARARKSFDDILNGSELTLAKLTVAVAHLRELAEQ